MRIWHRRETCPSHSSQFALRSWNHWYDCAQVNEFTHPMKIIKSHGHCVYNCQTNEHWSYVIDMNLLHHTLYRSSYLVHFSPLRRKSQSFNVASVLSCLYKAKCCENVVSELGLPFWVRVSIQLRILIWQCVIFSTKIIICHMKVLYCDSQAWLLWIYLQLWVQLVDKSWGMWDKKYCSNQSK